jgi:hypothetical protein
MDLPSGLRGETEPTRSTGIKIIMAKESTEEHGMIKTKNFGVKTCRAAG